MKIASQISLDNPRSSVQGASYAAQFVKMSELSFDPHLKVIKDGSSETGASPVDELRFRRSSSQVLPSNVNQGTEDP